jgi:hypothetical protein
VTLAKSTWSCTAGVAVCGAGWAGEDVIAGWRAIISARPYRTPGSGRASRGGRSRIYEQVVVKAERVSGA